MSRHVTERALVCYGRPHLRNEGKLRIGEGVVVKSSPVKTILHVGPGATLDIGDRVYIGQGANITAHAFVEIGDDARIGDFAIIVDTDFHTADRQTKAEPSPIHIGKRAMIGAHATILRGTRIGEDVHVEPGSLVFGAIAPGARVGGNPAKVLASGAAGRR